MTFATDQLPSPSALEYESGAAFYVGGGWQDGGVLAVRAPDDEVDPLRWSLVYSGKPAAVLRALRDHYRTYLDRSFDWRPPGGTTALRVVYSEATTIRWRNPTNGDARVSLEEALAH